MRIRRSLVGGVLLLGAAAAAWAQAPSRVTGRVIDAATQAPVAMADVVLGDRRTGTRENGEFVLGAIPPGRYVLHVRRLGYGPWRSVVEVVPGLDRSVVVELEPLAVRLDSISVVAAPGGITISGEDLARRGGDLGRSLDGWEGVVMRRAAGTTASPQLRGGGPDEVLVVVDGFTVNDPLTGRADLSRIPSRDVAQVTLLPGAQAVRAGARAIAGVILVETRHLTRPEGATWVSSYGARGLRVGAGTGGLSVTASTSRDADGFPYSVPEVRGGGEALRLNAGGTRSTVAARWEGPVEIILRGTQTRQGLPGTTTNPTPVARGDDKTVFLGIHRTGGIHGSASLQWLETRAADAAPPTGTPYDNYSNGIGARAETGYRAPMELRGWSGEAGLAVEGRGDRFAGDGVRSGASFSQAALRADVALHRGSETIWTVAPAARLDYWTGVSRPLASVRVDAGWQRGPLALNASLGSAVTPPALADLLFREGVGVKLNPDLRPERVRWELEVGARRELGNRGSLSARLFYGRVGDMIVWAPDFRFIWSPRNFDVRRRGGEVSVALRPGRTVRADATATYSAVTYDFAGGAQVQYRPRVTYAAALSWSPAAWSADVRWRHLGARFPNAAGTNSRPPISQVDLGVERTVGALLGIRMEIHDLTDSRAEFIAGYPTPGRSFSATLNFQLP